MKELKQRYFVVFTLFHIFLLGNVCSAPSIDLNIFMYATCIRISIYIHSKGWIHKYPHHTACCYEFLPCLSPHLFHHLSYLSLCPSLCPHYTRMTREEVTNLRITGDVKRGGRVLFAFTPLHLIFSSYLQFLFLLWCPLPTLFSYFFFFFRCVIFIPSCANLKEEDHK